MSDYAQRGRTRHSAPMERHILDAHIALWKEHAQPLHKHVQDLVNIYLEKSEEVRRTRPQAEWPRFRPRVEEGEAGPRIYWEKKQFRTGVRGQRFAQWGKVGKNGHPTRYPASTFKEAPAWEKPLALMLEKHFEKIRQYVHGVRSMRRTVEANARRYYEILHDG